MLLLTSWLSGLFDLGWSVDGFWTALLGSLIVSIVSFVLNAFIPDRDDERRRVRPDADMVTADPVRSSSSAGATSAAPRWPSASPSAWPTTRA